MSSHPTERVGGPPPGGHAILRQGGGHEGQPRHALAPKGGEEALEESNRRIVEAAKLLPREKAERLSAVVFDRTGPKSYVVGMVDASSLEATEEIARALKTTTQGVVFQPIGEEEFARWFRLAYAGVEQEDSLAEVAEARRSSSWSQPGGAEALFRDTPAGGSELEDITDERRRLRLEQSNPWELTTREFAIRVLSEGFRAKASDIHVEVTEEGGRIRFRCDGRLIVKWRDIPIEKTVQLVNALAIMGRLQPSDLKFRPQKSLIELKLRHLGTIHHVEYRVEFFPTLPFPEAVLRIGRDPIKSLEKVGFFDFQLEDIFMGIGLNEGMTLVTGPTGSGKSNTLLGIYTEWERDDDLKIIEMADPIEYRSSRRTQIQITPECSWIDALTASLRGDPDVIAVGECREKDVMKVALQAATTGHRVPTTLHTNDVASTFTRVSKMGIPPSIMADALNLIVSQRLIRKLCEHCKELDEPQSVVFNQPIYQAKGCVMCYGMGYWGRTIISETLYIRPELRDMMSAGKKGREVVRFAVESKWMIPMRDVARAKMLQGVTSHREIESAMTLKINYEPQQPHARREAQAEEPRQRSAPREEEPEAQNWVDAEVIDVVE